MQALQHQYTSCRKGQSGSAGFQTRTLTQGLRPDDQREIERRGIYTPPRNAKQEPTDEEILQDYPVAFRYYPLESERWALTYSCYAGQDYSGRWGNYFAHTLIGDEGLPPFWPIDYYEWKGWKNGLSQKEDTEEDPPLLPSVDLRQIPPSESFTFTELSEFLKEVPSRRQFLANMLRAVFKRQETSRALIIRDTFLNGLFWIACIQKAFPITCLRKMSFSTYQYDDRNSAAINITTEGTEFSFDEAQRKYQFFMFDFIRGQHSEMLEPESDYAEIVAGWMATDPTRLSEFHEFLRLFDYHTPGPELEWVARLFQSSVGEGSPLTADELAAIIEFISRFTATHGRGKMIEMLAPRLRLLQQGGKGIDYDRYIRFFGEIARDSRELKHRHLAFAAWVQMFDAMVIMRGAEFDQVTVTRNDLMRSLAGYESELFSIFLSDQHMQNLRGNFTQLPPEVLGELLKEIILATKALGSKHAWNGPDSKAIISAMLNSREDPGVSAQRIFDAIGQDASAIAGTCRFIALTLKAQSRPELHKLKSIAIGRVLRDVLARMSPNSASEIRKSLNTPDTWDFLYGEWLELIDTLPNKQQIYNQYVESLARSFPDYMARYGPQIAESLIRRLDEEDRSQQAMDWVMSKEVQSFPTEFARECVTLANQSIPLDPDRRDFLKKAQQLTTAADKHKVRLVPDRPFLLDLLIQASNSSHIADLPLSDLHEELKAIDGPSYTDFLATFLKNAIGKAKSGAEHKAVLMATYNRAHFDRFKSAYLQQLQLRSKQLFSVTDEGTLVFWIGSYWRNEKLMDLGHFQDEVGDIILKRIKRMDEEHYFRLNEHMWGKAQELGPEGLRVWKSIGEERESRSRSFLGGLLGKKKS